MANSANRAQLISYLSGTQATQAMGRNYVINPSGFENVNDITVSGATIAVNTTTPLTSISDLSIALGNNATDTVLWSTKTLDNEMSGQNCELRFVYTAASIGSNVVAVVQQGGTTVAQSSALAAVTTPQVVSLNAPCGNLSGATTVGIINGTGNSGTSAIKIANVTYGRATNLNNVSQAQMYGSARYAGTASCNWASTSAVWANFAADADCPTPTLIGNATAPGTKIPGITFTSLPPGRYMVVATGQMQSEFSGTATQFGWAISDGTNRSGFAVSYSPTASDAASNPGNNLNGVFEYTTTQTNITFQIQTIRQSGSGTAYIINQVATDNEVKLTVYRFPSSSEIALNSNSTPWYIDSNLSGANFSLGTSAVSTYTEMTNAGITLTQNTGSSAVGVACSGTNASTVGSTTCSAGSESNGITFNIPVAGSYLACTSFSAGGSVNANGVLVTGFQIVETPSNAQTILQEGKSRVGYTQVDTSGNNTLEWPFRVCGNFVFSGSGQKTLRLMYEQAVVATVNSSYVVADAGSGSGQKDVHWEVYPITNQQPQPLLVGSVTSNTSGLERIERATVADACGSSPCTIASQSGSWLTSITRGATGLYTLNFAAGIFSSAPSCSVIPVSAASNVFLRFTSAPTTSAGSTQTVNTAGVAVDSGLQIQCMGPRA